METGRQEDKEIGSRGAEANRQLLSTQPLTSNRQPPTSNREPCLAVNLEPRTVNIMPQPRTLNLEPRTVNHGRWTLDVGPRERVVLQFKVLRCGSAVLLEPRTGNRQPLLDAGELRRRGAEAQRRTGVQGSMGAGERGIVGRRQQAAGSDQGARAQRGAEAKRQLSIVNREPRTVNRGRWTLDRARARGAAVQGAAVRQCGAP